MLRQRMRGALGDFKDALARPTLKQKEAYGRLAHTLCVACCVGAITVLFGAAFSFWTTLLYVCSLMIWGLVLFVAGAILSKGE
ncbi:hypothetical protein C6571_18890 (plasmid) [Simplicispira suum]|uniref:Uncharacterized protein n=1 Tax=Simplicispira suum TaxID=2109915 RepID=A0A2S0N693_9BURK|nr:hypothetical protein Alide_4554 [Alicycliphilus denitrificans BC]AVO43491.1 hypothetical protein C6571_18890 [Simplicispira suum]